MTTTIVNFYGGPSSGKSTSAAFIYYQLKTQHVNVELVTEYVKSWAWEQRDIKAYDQIYFLGKQVRRESMLYGKVDTIVTDSPVMMNLYYAQRYCPTALAEGIRASTLSFYRQATDDGHKHVHVMLKRNKPYKSEGRYQNENEAREIDDGVRLLLNTLKVPIIESTPDEEDLLKILEKIKA